MEIASGARFRIGLEFLWFVVLALVVLLDPSVSKTVALGILASSAVWQIAEPFLIRPLVGRFRLGALAVDSLSAGVKKVTRFRSKRFCGMARTRWMSALCAGSLIVTYLNKERIATRRKLRVRAVFLRSVSR